MMAKAECDDPSSYWAFNFGISAVGFGQFFSPKSADKLKVRADIWENNVTIALASLDTIYNSVSGRIWSENQNKIQDSFFFME